MKYRGVRTRGRERPVLDLAGKLVRRGLVDPGPDRIAIRRGDLSRGRQPGDLGRDRRGRVAGLLLPALNPVGGTMSDEEVGRGNDVVVVERASGQAGLPGHQDRV